jgi:type I restriction enzyme M protein
MQIIKQTLIDEMRDIPNSLLVILNHLRSKRYDHKPVAILEHWRSCAVLPAHINDAVRAASSDFDGARAVLDNYRPHIPIDPTWPMVEVSTIVQFVSGLTVSIPEVEAEDGIPIIAINNITENGQITLEGLRFIKPPRKTLNYLQKGDLLFNWRNGSKHLVGKTGLFNLDGQYLFASFLLGIRPDTKQVNSAYLWHTLNNYRFDGRYMQFMRQIVNGLFNCEELKNVIISLPSLETQKSIIAEIEAEQALVNSNRELIARFEKKIQTTLARI